jgi:Cu/Ag efflux protein CusF
MTMDFKIRDGLEITDLDPGQHIAFEFTTDGAGTVTRIQPVP